MNKIPSKIYEFYNTPEFLIKWENYDVYVENYGEDCPAIGMPEFLLFKDNFARYANEEEIHSIMAILPDE